jgi:hypothetical protein
MKYLKSFVIGLFILVATAPGGARGQAIDLPTREELKAKGIEPLDSKALVALLTNNTLYHINPMNGFRVPLVYFEDGTRLVRIRGQVLKTSWRVERDMVCEESVILKKEVCRSLYRSPKANAVCDEGASKCDYGLDWEKGNPEGLKQ